MQRPGACTGACDERRVELVDAGEAQSAEALLYEQRRRAGVLAGVVGRLAQVDAHPGGEQAAWRRLQDEARAALRVAGPAPRVEPATRITAWWCATCDRIDAPQPCLGICVWRPREHVLAGVHAEVAAHLDVATERTGRLEAVVRRLAWSTPRPGGWATSLAALRAAARQAL